MTVSKKVIQAAISGPEKKKVKIKESANSSRSHQFNVKTVSTSINAKGELIVYGQISHHLKWRIDDQHWYGFKKVGDKVIPKDVSKMLLEKKDGGILKTIELLRPIGVLIGAYKGQDAGKYFDELEKNADKFSFLDFDKGYEKSIKHFLSVLSKEIKPPRWIKKQGLTLCQHRSFKGKKIFFKVNENIASLKPISWDDRASSLQATVPKDMKLEVFKNSNFTGTKLEFGPGSHQIHDLKIHRLGDKLSSLRWSKA